MFALGVAGVVTAGVYACRSTLKLEETLDEVKHDFDSVKEMKETVNQPGVSIEKKGNYTEQDYYKDLIYVYGRAAIKVTKLYGPSVLIGTVSIGLLTTSHVQLARRNAALTVTLTAVSKAYDDYRMRVQKEIGRERELDLYHGTETMRVEGTKDLVKVTNQGGSLSIYSRVFDSDCPNFKNDVETNRFFVQCQQNYANHLLTVRGHVFLNDVYDSLGLERSTPGAVVGWVRDGNGDGYIDFGIHNALNMRYLDNYQHCLILDFNVDGVVYDLIEEHR